MLTQTVAGRTWDFSHVVGRVTEAGTGFRLPYALALGEGDVVYVLSRGTENIGNVTWNHTGSGARVSKLTIGTVPGDEELVGEIGKYGDGPGEFIWGTGLALDSQGNLYLVDEWLHRVSIFDKADNFSGLWGTFGDGDGQFNSPSGIAIDRQDNVYIVDSLNHRIQKLTTDGKFLAKWGKHGSGEGEFRSPWGITTDADGYVYVADHKNHRVQKFTTDGEFVAQFGAYGEGRGELKRPTGVAVDPDGDVYVCDWANNRVQVFGSDGRFITTFNGDAQEMSKWGQMTLDANVDYAKVRRMVYTREPEWRFCLPTALVFDADKTRLVVADSQRHRLQIYNKPASYAAPRTDL